MAVPTATLLSMLSAPAVLTTLTGCGGGIAYWTLEKLYLRLCASRQEPPAGSSSRGDSSATGKDSSSVGASKSGKAASHKRSLRRGGATGGTRHEHTIAKLQEQIDALSKDVGIIEADTRRNEVPRFLLNEHIVPSGPPRKKPAPAASPTRGETPLNMDDGGDDYVDETTLIRRPSISLERSLTLQRSGVGLAPSTQDALSISKHPDGGYGCRAMPDGSRYEGQLSGGLKHGKGRYVGAEGDVFEGEWHSGRAHGQGTYTSKGSTYSGEWLNDLKHGEAVEDWDDESKYVGAYMHGQKHGRGRFEWPDGSVYEGDFRNSCVQGEGTFTWKDGRRYHGQWMDNLMHGEGRYEWPDGRSFEGQYVNDVKEGGGTFIWPDRRSFVGTWKDGKQHGQGVFKAAHGETRTGEWRDGIRICWTDNLSPQRMTPRHDFSEALHNANHNSGNGSNPNHNSGNGSGRESSPPPPLTVSSRRSPGGTSVERFDIDQ